MRRPAGGIYIMRKLSILVPLCLMFLAFSANAASGSQSHWEAAIVAEGEDLGGVSVYEVVIGVADAGLQLEAPPAPPEYSVRIELLGSEGMPLSMDVRKGEGEQIWIIRVDPSGNIMPPGSRDAVLSWTPADLGNGRFEIREGFGLGKVVVADMKATAKYEINGSSVIILSIHHIP